ncbi:hypothetical protein Cni_G09889 [Canna indica]|uniref:Uncharacterized protein n=1 Tax=Canna indica TaxID=4628 RepID=A0AAQ3K569_9LILI|nr:hypothetical protein Cni_G09889 [Canna indica]
MHRHSLLFLLHTLCRTETMKRSRAENGASSKDSDESPAKFLLRQKESTTTMGWEKPEATLENAREVAGDGQDAVTGSVDIDLQRFPSVAFASAEEVTGAEWWWCLWGVEEEKLLGWIPFVEEDFLCFDSRGGLLWEEADHDIWQLQHINEIPHRGATN